MIARWSGRSSQVIIN